MTPWQINFASDFWTKQLQKNEQITDIDAKRFRAALGLQLKRGKPAAVCTVIRPQMSLTLALKEADLPENALPISQIDLVFMPDGTIRIFDGQKWDEQHEPKS